MILTIILICFYTFARVRKRTEVTIIDVRVYLQGSDDRAFRSAVVRDELVARRQPV